MRKKWYWLRYPKKGHQTYSKINMKYKRVRWVCCIKKLHEIMNVTIHVYLCDLYNLYSSTYTLRRLGPFTWTQPWSCAPGVPHATPGRHLLRCWHQKIRWRRGAWRGSSGEGGSTCSFWKLTDHTNRPFIFRLRFWAGICLTADFSVRFVQRCRDTEPPGILRRLRLSAAPRHRHACRSKVTDMRSMKFFQKGPNGMLRHN